MQIIKYNLINRTNTGTSEEPVWEEVKGEAVTMGCNERNLEIAKAEAWNGEYTIEDDGEPEPTADPTPQDDTDAMLVDLEYRLTLLELGISE